jgi:apolipoprotein N-acyltransferase
MKSFFLALLSGVLLAACFPPWELTWCVWLWPWPLLAVLFPQGGVGPVSKKRAFSLGYVSGLAAWLSSLAWVIQVHWIGWIALSLYLALFTAVWALLVARFARMASLRHALWAASWWALLEWLRGWLLTGFSWNQLGIALHPWHWLIQPAEWVGCVGLAVPAMFLSLTGFLAWRKRAWKRPAFIGGGILLCWATLGYFLEIRATPVQPKKLEVVLVQPNVLQEDKWADSAIEYQASELPPEQVKAAQERILDRYRNLQFYTREAVAKGPVDLVVWPESSLHYPFHLEITKNFLNKVCEDGKFTLALGGDVTEHSEEAEPTYNCIIATRTGYKDADIYKKVHRVVFGEFVPFREKLPWLADALAGLIPGDMAAGTSTEPLTVTANAVQLIPLVCFEDTVARHARKFIRPQSQVLVNVTNDAWFNQSGEQEMHFWNARLRSVELRRPYVRSSNTGVTFALSSTGEVLGRLKKYEPGTLTVSVPLPSENVITLYANIGDLLPICLGSLTLFWAIVKGRRSPNARFVAHGESPRAET